MPAQTPRTWMAWHETTVFGATSHQDYTTQNYDDRCKTKHVANYSRLGTNSTEIGATAAVLSPQVEENGRADMRSSFRHSMGPAKPERTHDSPIARGSQRPLLRACSRDPLSLGALVLLAEQQRRGNHQKASMARSIGGTASLCEQRNGYHRTLLADFRS